MTEKRWLRVKGRNARKRGPSRTPKGDGPRSGKNRQTGEALPLERREVERPEHRIPKFATYERKTPRKKKAALSGRKAKQLKRGGKSPEKNVRMRKRKRREGKLLLYLCGRI